MFLEEKNKWHTSDITFNDGGVEVFLCGNGILSTYIPFEEGIAEGGFGYLIPELSEENYVFEQPKIEEANEKIEKEENYYFESETVENEKDDLKESSQYE